MVEPTPMCIWQRAQFVLPPVPCRSCLAAAVPRLYLAVCPVRRVVWHAALASSVTVARGGFERRWGSCRCLLAPRPAHDDAFGAQPFGSWWGGRVWSGMGGDSDCRSAPVDGAMSSEMHSHLGCCCCCWYEWAFSGLSWEADPTEAQILPVTVARLRVRDLGGQTHTYMARTPRTCTHTHKHARTHARTHTRTHACTHAPPLSFFCSPRIGKIWKQWRGG